MLKKRASSQKVSKFKELARLVIEHYFGSPPQRTVYKSAGLSNYVFAAKHSDGEFIVRISPEPAAIESFIREQWAQRAAEKVGVPTTEILEVGSSLIPYPYMISTSATGREATNHPEKSKIIREMGNLAAKINSVRTKGFGVTFDWSNNLLSKNNSWKEYIETEYAYEEKIELLETKNLIAPQQSRRLRKIFSDAIKLNPKAALNHGDIRLKNVMVDRNGKITAIIDWEKVSSNLSPHWELSLALHDLGIDEMQWFIEGYDISPKKLIEAAPLIKAFNMLNYVPKIERAIRKKDKTSLEGIRLRLAGVFDLYSV
jgi:hygromycin-B 4-O-kinase